MLNSTNIAIIGAGGAIGSEFVRQIAHAGAASIHAFSSSKQDFALDNVLSHLIDIEDENSIAQAAQEAAKNGKLDMVIVAIGMLHNQEIMPEKSLRELSKDKFNQLFAINTIAPALIAKYFIPLLNKENKSIFAALSARVGSISDNHLGGWYAYRASKAALNMILKNLSIEMKRTNPNAVIAGLHPGTVDSTLSKPFQAAVKEGKLFSPQHSVKMLLNVLDNLTAPDSGNVFDFNGLKIDA
ncbi:MAG: SDR family NAD(P)-dependent oxidoreductase [Proteobacteria bacterium]|nr:SDR family NAD(P)-dependent oxidoreductase [Pseudomonadota bacterium]